jgi:hypothetical protein
MLVAGFPAKIFSSDRDTALKQDESRCCRELKDSG